MPDAIADPSASAIDDNKVFVAVRVRPLSASERERSKNAWDVVDDEIIVPRVRTRRFRRDDDGFVDHYATERRMINSERARGFVRDRSPLAGSNSDAARAGGTKD